MNGEKETNVNAGAPKGVPVYWQDIHQKVLSDEELSKEFQSDPNLEYDSFGTKKGRRDFLKIMGFSVSALPLSSCIRIPVKKALPYLKKNETITPGVANWYATVSDNAGLLVKTREGRPIKIEGNPLSGITRGGVFAKDQGSLLSLYDSSRYTAPKTSGKNTSWELLDKELKQKLSALQNEGKEILLVTPSFESPSFRRLVNQLKIEKGVRTIAYDGASRSSLVAASKEVYGRSLMPRFVLEKADLIVSFGADFLGTWPNAVEMTKQFSRRRDLKVSKNINRLIQVESGFSLTGANADWRLPVEVDHDLGLLLSVLDKVAKKMGRPISVTWDAAKVDDTKASKLAEELWANRGKSLVLVGANNREAQIAGLYLNYLLGNTGTTVVATENIHGFYAEGDSFGRAIERMESGKVGAVIFLESNPVYDYPEADRLRAALKKVPVTISLSQAPDETSTVCQYVAPGNHFLEAWGDTAFRPNEISFRQPVMTPMYGSRIGQESLLAWFFTGGTYHEYVKATWKGIYQLKNLGTNFSQFWNKALHDGILILDDNEESLSFDTSKVNEAARILAKEVTRNFAKSGLKVTLYQKVSMGDGRYANNPWLQELPDPITKATWENYLQVSPAWAKKENVTSGDVVSVKIRSKTFEVVALVQAGLAANSFGLALGYGRSVCGKVGKGVGVNAFQFVGLVNGEQRYRAEISNVRKTGKKSKLALTQTHHSYEGRDIVREASLAEYKADPKVKNHKKIPLISMWGDHKKGENAWAMSIDLNKCTGCSACVVSCSVENNVPVVGKKEVAMSREMHWLRIDRYYSGTEEEPSVVHQPIACQHCDNAPCETVCPVLATVQSSDGLNQQVYNRCVGTRYCANNCPYKVRRFNWFDYARDDAHQNMALNPDIAIRSRGIMEKCSMCIQRIQEGRLTAKKEGRPVQDGDIQTACQQSCPGEAIVFGDLLDKESEIAQTTKDPRNYTLLEELNVRPKMSFLTKIRNS